MSAQNCTCLKGSKSFVYLALRATSVNEVSDDCTREDGKGRLKWSSRVSITLVCSLDYQMRLDF